MKEDKYTKSLAKNQVYAIVHMQDIRKNVLPKFIMLCVETLVSPQGAHTMCLCSRLLFYSKCTGFNVCFTYSYISLTMYINQ